MQMTAVAAGQSPFAANPQTTPPRAAETLLGEVINEATGVVQAEGGVLGVGPGYRTWFARDGVRLAAPGATTPALTLALDAVGRRDASGETDWSVPSAAEPEVLEGLACYRREQVVERYEMRRDGIEQSFVFAELPRGTGDLVIRLRVETDLVAHPSADGSQAVFTGAGRGASIRGVLGLDAAGAECSGVVRVSEGQVELLLLGAFVDSAVLPLVVDPLIGNLFTTGGTPPAVISSVAYDSTNDVYLVAWTENMLFSTQHTTLGRLVSSDGSLKGGLLCLECEAGYRGMLQSVVNVNARDMFVVAINLYFPATVSAATGGVVVARNLLRTEWGSLGGDSTLTDDDVVHAWVDKRSVPTNVVAEEIDVSPAGALTITKSVVVGTGGLNSSLVSIAKSGGRSGRYLVAWYVGPSSSSGPIHGVVVDRDLNALSPLVIVPTFDALGADVVGDGNQWLVSYSTLTEMRGVPVSWDSILGSAWTAPSIRIVPSSFGGVIGWMDGSVVIHHDPVGPEVIGSIDPYTCQPCEVGQQVTGIYRMGTQISGDPNAGPWGLVAQQLGSARFYRADDGITTDLGGGCGSGGRAAATCARVGNAGFTVRLRDSRHGAPAFLVLGTQSLSFACGTCTLMVNPLTVVGAGLTDVHGNAEVLLPIANNPGWIGQAFLEQWITVGGTACSLGVEMSNALRVQLQ